MHTLKVIAVGLVLLAVCLVIGRWTQAGGASSGLAFGALIFLPLWFIGAGINMWMGIARAGYTLAEEAPVFLVVYGVPAAVAGIIWWRASRA